MSDFPASTSPTGDEIVRNLAKEAHGKTFLITGPSAGSVGGQTAIILASAAPKQILLAGRNKSKIQPVFDEIVVNHPNVLVTFVSLDLADQSSIRTAAKAINSQIEKLDVLINCAGVMAVQSYQTTSEGIEIQFGVNHIGHFLLTSLLMPKIFASGEGARIINVSSMGYISGGVRFDDWNFKNGAEYNEWLAYGQSKSANILTASALAKKLKSAGILAFSLNPGYIPSSNLQDGISGESFAEGYAIALKALNGDPFPGGAMNTKTIAQGTATVLYAALDPSLREHSGAFLNNEGIFGERLRENAVGAENEDKLWQLSEKLTGEDFKLTAE